jgi:glycosyl transferase, family 25
MNDLTEAVTKNGVCIYVISLQQAEQRRKSVIDQLTTCSYPWQFVDAILADSLLVRQSSERPSTSSKWHKPLRGGEIACYLSHQIAWRHALSHDVRYALILEDDFQLLDQADSIIELLLKFDTKSDIIKLFGKPKRFYALQTVEHNHKEYQLCKAYSLPACTVAQWVHHSALPHLLKKSELLERPVDIDMKHYWEYPLAIHQLCPAIVEEISTQLGGSGIANRKTGKTALVVIKRLLHKVFYYWNCMKFYQKNS